MTSILFLAGDLSGDEHTARLMRELQTHRPEWQQFAVGGDAMRATGATYLGDSRGTGVIGIVPSLALLPRVAKLRRHVLNWVEKNRPALVVMCDWGAFNARLLKPLHSLHIPVLYYFPPSSWRKHGTRGLSIAPYVQRVATPFEWSAQRFQKVGCNAEWVGHPVLESLRPLEDASPEKMALRHSFGVEPHQRLVAILSGSRALELRYIAPHLRDTVRLMKTRGSATNTLWVVAAAPGTSGRVRKVFGELCEVVEGRTGDLLQACDAAIVKSGTSTLEAAVAGAPQVIVYDVPAAIRLQWRLQGGSKKIPFVGMPNIILEREVARELLGDNCRPEPIAEELEKLLNDVNYRERQHADYALVRRALGSDLPQGATQRTCRIIEEMVTP